MEVPESTVRRVGYVGEGPSFFNHLSDGLVFLPLVRLGMGAGLFHLLMAGGGCSGLFKPLVGMGLS